MIVKKRGISLRIQMLQAILRNLSKSHHKRPSIEAELARREAGIRGEESIEDYLEFLPEKKYLIFHDIRLTNGRKYFQIDTLLVSANLLVIIEIKNMYGELFFDQDSEQLIRTYNEKREAFQYPISQAEHQQRQLKRWLENEKIPVPPIKCLVIVSQPRTILSTNPGRQSLFKIVCHPDKLLNRIQLIQNSHPKEELTSKELRKITRLLLSKHTPHIPELLEIYGLKEEELFEGLICGLCHYRPLRRQERKWMCPRCKQTATPNVDQYINDFLLLIQPSITNRKLREIMKLSSRNVATKILRRSNILPDGTKKSRVYRRL